MKLEPTLFSPSKSSKNGFVNMLTVVAIAERAALVKAYPGFQVSTKLTIKVRLKTLVTTALDSSLKIWFETGLLSRWLTDVIKYLFALVDYY